TACGGSATMSSRNCRPLAVLDRTCYCSSLVTGGEENFSEGGWRDAAGYLSRRRTRDCRGGGRGRGERAGQHRQRHSEQLLALRIRHPLSRPLSGAAMRIARVRGLLIWARASNVVRLALLAIAAAFCAYGLATEWPGVQAALGRVHWYLI